MCPFLLLIWLVAYICLMLHLFFDYCFELCYSFQLLLFEPGWPWKKEDLIAASGGG